MDGAKQIFLRRKLIPSKLLPYGFTNEGDQFTLRKTLAESGFVLTVRITPAGEISTEMTDPSTDDVYTLHLADGVAGGFVGTVRDEYAEILTDIASHCFETDVFKAPQTLDLIDYVARRYGNDPLFLWKSSPTSAVWRRRDTGKWYGVLMTIPRRKLGGDSDETVEILDFHCPPEKISALFDGKSYFPGWHMNKKHWCTVILDGVADTEEICRKIDISYGLAEK